MPAWAWRFGGRRGGGFLRIGEVDVEISPLSVVMYPLFRTMIPITLGIHEGINKPCIEVTRSKGTYQASSPAPYPS